MSPNAIRLMLAFLLATVGAVTSNSRPAPEFTHHNQEDWINSKPLSLSDLRGRVVIVDFWTFACWNCYRSFPWLNDLEARMGSQGLRVLGVHSPELESERSTEHLKQKISEYKIKHPVMIDTDFSYWKAMGNSAWPTFYVLDKNGNVRGVFSGETHAGDPQAQDVERLVASLIAEQ